VTTEITNLIETGVAGSNGLIVIRNARVRDVPQIFKLVNAMARLKNNLLPRSMSELYEHVRDFFVAVDGEQIIATCSLHIYWEDLAEVRSLAVDLNYQGQGWGDRLMKVTIAHGDELGLLRLFTLTTIPAFFERFDFVAATREQLPQKTWSECFKCTKFTECDETALLLDLAPGYTGPQPVARANHIPIVSRH